MDDLERGPLPISVRPIPHNHNIEDEELDDDINCDRGKRSFRSRSINNILNQKPEVTTRRERDDDDDERVTAKGLTAELRDFAERIIGLENMKMEMMKETERFRLEMENKRMRLILESQWRIVDSIGRAFRSS